MSLCVQILPSSICFVTFLLLVSIIQLLAPLASIFFGFSLTFTSLYPFLHWFERSSNWSSNSLIFLDLYPSYYLSHLFCFDFNCSSWLFMIVFSCFVSVIFSLISDYIYCAFLYSWWPTCSNHSASRSTHVLQSSVPLLCACSSRIWVCWLVHSYTLCLVKCVCSRTCDSPAPRVCAASEMERVQRREHDPQGRKPWHMESAAIPALPNNSLSLEFSLKLSERSSTEKT